MTNPIDQVRQQMMELVSGYLISEAEGEDPAADGAQAERARERIVDDLQMTDDQAVLIHAFTVLTARLVTEVCTASNVERSPLDWWTEFGQGLYDDSDD